MIMSAKRGNMNRFTLTQTNSLKGLFAIGVVLSHLCSRTGLGSSIGLGPIYTALGYWGVSVFLFISGFGLINRSRAISNGGEGTTFDTILGIECSRFIC